MKRVLHLVRTTLPPDVAGPDDLVVYTPESVRAAAVPLPPPANTRIWVLHDQPQTHQSPGHITSADLYRLCFELDTVVVW